MRKFLTVAASCAALLLFIAAPSAVAQPGGHDNLVDEQLQVQTAWGTTAFGSACIKGYCWPGGQFNHYIKGDGLRITYQGAGASDLIGAGSSGKQFCNWRIDFVDYNSYGRSVRTSYGPTNWGCDWAGVERVVGADRTAKTGTAKACAILRNNGDQVAKQCHSIHP